MTYIKDMSYLQIWTFTKLIYTAMEYTKSQYITYGNNVNSRILTLVGLLSVTCFSYVLYCTTFINYTFYNSKLFNFRDTFKAPKFDFLTPLPTNEYVVSTTSRSTDVNLVLSDATTLRSYPNFAHVMFLFA